jgi:hypothetical protein
VIVYICAIVIASVRLVLSMQAFVKLHGSDIIRGSIVRTYKSECMECVRSDESLHQVCVADSVSSYKSTCNEACVLSRLCVCN